MSQERKSHVRKSRFGSQYRSRQKALEKVRAEERKLHETQKKNIKVKAEDDDEVIFHLNSELNGFSGKTEESKAIHSYTVKNRPVIYPRIKKTYIKARVPRADIMRELNRVIRRKTEKRHVPQPGVLA